MLATVKTKNRKAVEEEVEKEKRRRKKEKRKKSEQRGKMTAVTGIKRVASMIRVENAVALKGNQQKRFLYLVYSE